MQNPENQHNSCRTCFVRAGEPCLTRRGREAERVHYGRGRATSPHRWRAQEARPVKVVDRTVYAERYAEVEAARYGD